VRRAAQLVLGLFLAALGIVCTLRSGLGVSPWDVLHGGLAERLHLSFERLFVRVVVPDCG